MHVFFNTEFMFWMPFTTAYDNNNITQRFYLK